MFCKSHCTSQWDIILALTIAIVITVEDVFLFVFTVEDTLIYSWRYSYANHSSHQQIIMWMGTCQIMFWCTTMQCAIGEAADLKRKNEIPLLMTELSYQQY